MKRDTLVEDRKESMKARGKQCMEGRESRAGHGGRGRPGCRGNPSSEQSNLYMKTKSDHCIVAIDQEDSVFVNPCPGSLLM